MVMCEIVHKATLAADYRNVCVSHERGRGGFFYVVGVLLATLARLSFVCGYVFVWRMEGEGVMSVLGA